MDSLKNVSYFLERLNGFQKNTVMVQPEQFQETYRPLEHKIEFMLPQNAIIDLHTLVLSFDLEVTNNTTATSAGWYLPRYSSAWIRRLDLTMGNMQVGLSNLPDYGSAYTLVTANSLNVAKLQEMSVLENGQNIQFNGQHRNPGTFYRNGAITAPFLSYYRFQITNFLGLLEGRYMRYLDTNLLPDCKISITLQPNVVIANAANATVKATYGWVNPRMYAEICKFGDGTYEQMVAARMSTGEPIAIPFRNWSMYESAVNLSSGQTASLQFTVASQSLDRLWGTFRVGDYDTQTSTAVQTTGPGTSAMEVFGVGEGSGGEMNTYYYKFTCLNGSNNVVTQQGNAQTMALTKAGVSGNARYQFEVDSKLYPQFFADAADAYFLTKNALDKSAMDLVSMTSTAWATLWAGQTFALVTSFKYNDSNDGTKDRLISGLNTAGSNIPIVWRGMNLTLPVLSATWMTQQVRPTVFVEMTSSLLVYPGRVVSVVN